MTLAQIRDAGSAPYLKDLADTGYTVIKGAMPAGPAGALLAALKRLQRDRGESTAEQPFLNRGHDVLCSLHREDIAYTRAFTADPLAMAGATPIETRAGDIVIWDSRLWHGALGDGTGESRWALIANFVRWWIKQSFDLTGSLPQSIYEALSDDAKAVLGYCTIPPYDGHERTDMKSGHAKLRPHVADYDRPKRGE